jgi:pyruvate formate lyase activating enzyme
MNDNGLSKRDFIKYGLLGIGGIAANTPGINLIANNTAMEKNTAAPKPGKWTREAYHYIKTPNAVRCQLCPNNCIIRNGDKSVCHTRVNIDNTLYTIAYGNPNTVHIDPIEKKPLFHFLPGTRAYSVATSGCTLACLNCQNWEISQVSPDDTANYDMFPDKVVEEAVKNNTKSIAYTYSEPIAFYDYTFDTSRIAKAKGIKNVLISNGYINEKPLRELAKYIDAANINLKSFSDDIYIRLNGGRLQPILDTLKILSEEKVWLEITNLIVPTWTDNLDMVKKMCDWIYSNQLHNYPLHFIRFHPMYKLNQLPETPVSVLEKARDIAMNAGIRYVYVGNVPGHAAENTFCHKCKKMIIERKGFTVITDNIKNGKCNFCGESIPGVWS